VADSRSSREGFGPWECPPKYTIYVYKREKNYKIYIVYIYLKEKCEYAYLSNGMSVFLQETTKNEWW
jgi:hypothetical protein